MDDRKFLDKIRELQKSGKKVGLTEITDTKYYEQKTSTKKFLTESTSEGIQNIEADEQRDEENKFKDIVSKLVKFQPIKVHQENVEWSGHLIREKIDWTFSLDDTVGCYVYTTELIQLRDETLEVLKKLRGYYDVWSDEWSSRLTGTPTEEETEEVTPEEGTPEEGNTEEGAGFGF